MPFSPGLSFANDNEPTMEELDGACIWAYQTAWTARYHAEKTDVVVDAAKLARIRNRLLGIARKRQTSGESIGASFRRTALEGMHAFLGKDGNGESKWLVERMHPLTIVAEGTRLSPDAELDFMAAAIARKDRARNAAVPPPVDHPGNRAMPANKAFVAGLAVPQWLKQEMGVAS